LNIISLIKTIMKSFGAKIGTAAAAVQRLKTFTKIGE
jgi:hypothetical protein